MNNDKIILSVATTGSWPSKLQNPGLPVTPEEIAQAAVESWREGAAVVHVHVRDEAGKMTCDLSRFQRVKQLIRAQGCDILINFTTSGANWPKATLNWWPVWPALPASAVGSRPPLPRQGRCLGW
ncbi:MAG: 3-keto-5-aminohexanoate cleavage protein [Thermodesulfobacteriota bacterium]